MEQDPLYDRLGLVNMDRVKLVYSNRIWDDRTVLAVNIHNICQLHAFLYGTKFHQYEAEMFRFTGMELFDIIVRVKNVDDYIFSMRKLQDTVSIKQRFAADLQGVAIADLNGNRDCWYHARQTLTKDFDASEIIFAGL